MEQGKTTRMFPPSEEAVKIVIYHNQMVWIEQVRFLYPERYRKIADRVNIEKRRGVG